jgi:NADH pyrophosphatase NudC (nudix superfamily)
VKNVRYLGSNRGRFRNSLMLGFHATTRRRHRVSGREIADARWFDIPDLQASRPRRRSRWLIDRFVDEMTSRSA